MNKPKMAFENIAEIHTKEAINHIRFIANLSNAYEYEDRHIREIINTLESELNAMCLKFMKHASQNQLTYK